MAEPPVPDQTPVSAGWHLACARSLPVIVSEVARGAGGANPSGFGDRVTAGPTGLANRRKEHAVEAFDKLKKLIAEAEEDIRKAEGGNRAAGTRARGAMQDIKNAAQDVREKILELRDAGGTPANG